MGLTYQTGAHSNHQFGYMNVYQQLGEGNRYQSAHTTRLFYFQNLDVRKIQKPTKVIHVNVFCTSIIPSFVANRVKCLRDYKIKRLSLLRQFLDYKIMKVN